MADGPVRHTHEQPPEHGRGGGEQRGGEVLVAVALQPHAVRAHHRHQRHARAEHPHQARLGLDRGVMFSVLVVGVVMEV